MKKIIIAAGVSALALVGMQSGASATGMHHKSHAKAKWDHSAYWAKKNAAWEAHWACKKAKWAAMKAGDKNWWQSYVDCKAGKTVEPNG